MLKFGSSALLLCVAVLVHHVSGNGPFVNAVTVPETTTDFEDLVTTHAPTQAPGASVSCDPTSMTVLLDEGLLENHGTADDVHFEDKSCTGYQYEGSRVAVTTSYNDCGTISEQETDVIKFSNVVTYFKPKSVNGSLITRDFQLRIPVTCEMKRLSLLGTSYKPKLGMVNFTETGYGKFSMSLSRYSDSTFTSTPDNAAAQVWLGEPIHFGVNLTAVTDLTLLIDRCWATPNVYPMDTPQYVLIREGCAEDDTVAFYNMGALFKGFSVEAFAFIGEYTEVYVHCDVLVCDNTDANSRCAQGCRPRAKRSADSRGSSSKPHTISNGPLSDKSSHSSTSNEKETSWISNPVNMMLVGAAGFFVAMIAMVTVMKVRSRRKTATGYRPLQTQEA